MLRRAGDGSGRSGVRFSQVTSLTSAMLPRPEWVIFASDPLSAIGVNQTCGGPRAQNPLHHIPV
jgi:hypothetical protein